MYDLLLYEYGRRPLGILFLLYIDGTLLDGFFCKIVELSNDWFMIKSNQFCAPVFERWPSLIYRSQKVIQNLKRPVEKVTDFLDDT